MKQLTINIPLYNLLAKTQILFHFINSKPMFTYCKYMKITIM